VALAFWWSIGTTKGQFWWLGLWVPLENGQGPGIGHIWGNFLTGEGWKELKETWKGEEEGAFPKNGLGYF